MIEKQGIKYHTQDYEECKSFSSDSVRKNAETNLPLHQVFHCDARLSYDSPHLLSDQVIGQHDSSQNQALSKVAFSAHALPEGI